jgi:hypothetical protein
MSKGKNALIRLKGKALAAKVSSIVGAPITLTGSTLDNKQFELYMGQTILNKNAQGQYCQALYKVIPSECILTKAIMAQLIAMPEFISIEGSYIWVLNQ